MTKRVLTLFTLACAVTALAAIPATAAEEIVRVTYTPSKIIIEPVVEVDNILVKINSPNSCFEEEEIDRGEPAVIYLEDSHGHERPDGVYTWEVTVRPPIDSELQQRIKEVRESGDPEAAKELAQLLPPRQVASGFITIDRGKFVDGTQVEEEPRSSELQEFGSELGGTFGDGPQLSERVVLTNSDGVIRNSLCVGFDCVNSPSFSDSTIILTENNTRIKYDDTSSINNFPNRDWELEANSNLNGGGSYFAINDCGNSSQGGCANDTVFLVEANAPTNALRVDSAGRLGIRTGNPVVDLHIVDGDTPTVRLEQDGSSGFAPQTWDVAGNETSFFIRDASNGSTLPFRIFPGSPSSRLIIDSDGEVGVATTSPDDQLDVRVGSENGGITIESTNDGTLPQLTLTEPSGSWRFRVANNGNFVFNNASSGTSPAVFFTGADSNLLVVGGTDAPAADNDRVTINGELFIGASMVTPDYVFEPDYSLLSIDEQAAYMWSNKHLPAVGPATVASGDKHLVNVGAHQFGMLEELEKAHIYIGQLNSAYKELKTEKDGLAAEVDELRSLVEQLLAERQ